MVNSYITKVQEFFENIMVAVFFTASVKLKDGDLRLRLRICKTDAYVLLPKKIPDAEGTVHCRFPAGELHPPL